MTVAESHLMKFRQIVMPQVAIAGGATLRLKLQSDKTDLLIFWVPASTGENYS